MSVNENLSTFNRPSKKPERLQPGENFLTGVFEMFNALWNPEYKS